MEFDRAATCTRGSPAYSQLAVTARRYCFGVDTAYCSNFGHCIFEPPLGGLRTMYVNLGLIGKSVVDFLLVLIEVVLLGVMAEALPA